MPILTLTTDWGQRDHYLASFKAELISMMPVMQVIDISHEVEKFNTMQAAFIIQNCFKKFPAGTIHFIGVSCNENCNNEKPYVIVKTDGHYLIGEDNGIFSLILGKNEKKMIRLPVLKQSDRNEINSGFFNAIKKLAEGRDFNEIGTSQITFEESYFAQPTVDSRTIRGTIIFVDSFGNAIVNISKELFMNERKGRSFVIDFRKSEYSVSGISLSYEDVDVGEILALFNQDGYLEIAINKESAAKLLGLKLMEAIRIEFDDSQVS